MKNQTYQVFLQSLGILLIGLFAFLPEGYSQIKCGTEQKITKDLGKVTLSAKTEDEAREKYERRILRIAALNGDTCTNENCDLPTDFCVLNFDRWIRDDFEPTVTDNGDGTFTFDKVGHAYYLKCTECTDTLTKVVIDDIIHHGGEPILPKLSSPQYGQTAQGSHLLNDIYISPHTTLINIELHSKKGAKDIRIAIANSEGQAIREITLGDIPSGNFFTDIDVKGLSQGIYLLSILEEGQQKDTLRFMIQE